MASSSPDGEYAFFEDFLPEWGIDHIWLARDADGAVYYPVRPIIEALNLQRTDQTGFIQEDSRTKRGSRMIKAPSSAKDGKGGRQLALHLRKKEVGIWLANLDPERVNGIAKGRLDDFQTALWTLAERTIFKLKRSALASVEDTGEVLTFTGATQAEFVCDDGRRHVVRIENGEWRVFHPDEE